MFAASPAQVMQWLLIHRITVKVGYEMKQLSDCNVPSESGKHGSNPELLKHEGFLVGPNQADLI
jgi:hypothetical protein